MKNGKFKMKNVLKVFLLITLFIYHLPVFASDEGTTSAQFLKIPTNPKIEAMGGAGTSVFLDEIFYNPASISKLEKISARIGFTSWFEDISKTNLISVFPLRRFTIATNLSYFTIGGLKKFDSSGNEQGSLSQWSASFSFGIAKEFGNLCLGTVIKYIGEKIDTENANAFAIDAGLILPVSRTLSLGASMQNIGTKIKIADVESKLPQNLKAGLSLKPMDNLIFAFDMDKPSDGNTRQHFGGEITFSEKYFMRAGFQKFGKVSGMTFGFGIKFASSGWKETLSKTEQNFILDYSYQANSEFDAIHRFSLTYEF